MVTLIISRIGKTAEMKLPMELKPTYWSNVAGVVATFAIGFIWGGWISGRTAAGHATGAATIAVPAPASKKRK
jgi:hypothetical protein